MYGRSFQFSVRYTVLGERFKPETKKCRVRLKVKTEEYTGHGPTLRKAKMNASLKVHFVGFLLDRKPKRELNIMGITFFVRDFSLVTWGFLSLWKQNLIFLLAKFFAINHKFPFSRHWGRRNSHSGIFQPTWKWLPAGRSPLLKQLWTEQQATLIQLPKRRPPRTRTVRWMLWKRSRWR